MTEMTALEKAEVLQSNFKRAQQVIGRKEIRDEHWFDISKIQNIYDEAGVYLGPWAHVARSEAASEITEVIPAFQSKFELPQDTSHYIFRTPQIMLEPFQAIRLKNVYVSWDASNALARAYYVFDQDKRLINGLFFGAKPFVDTPVATFDKPVCFAEDVFMRFNIAHLLFDKYPRAHIARDLFGISESLLFFTNGYTDTIADLTDLTFHGIANDTKRGTIFAKELVCFSNSFHAVRHPLCNGAPNHVAAIEHLRSNALTRLGDGGEPVKYFLTRAANLPRGIVNMDEITPTLIAHGFEIGDAATMTPADQIRLFLRCSALGGAHGAGLTNLVFQPDGAKVIELMPPLMATMAYWKSAGALDREYCPVTCHDPELGDIAAEQNTSHQGRNNRGQLYVPLDRLTAALDSLKP